MGGAPSPPKAPNAAKDYQAGIDVMLKNLPQLLNAEEGYRQTQDPQRVEDFLGLQSKYGARESQAQLDRLHQIDPESAAVRKQLGSQVFNDLKSGYALPAGYRQELEQEIRGGQAARGNILGNAPSSAETVYKGKAALDLYQQHLDNAGQFLHAPTPEQQMLAIPAVTPDRSSGYVNPAAGLQGQQYGLSNYTNLLSQYQLAGGGGGNAWQRALKGASIGASQGSIGGFWGALGGAVGGGIDGAANGPIYQQQTGYSDLRLKDKLVFVAKTSDGVSWYEFNFIGDDTKQIGVIAQELELLRPDLVTKDVDGYRRVDYSSLSRMA